MSKRRHLDNFVSPKAKRASKEAKTAPKTQKSDNNGGNGKNSDSSLPVKPVKYNQKIDIDKAIELRGNGLTHQDLANYFNCSKASVS